MSLIDALQNSALYSHPIDKFEVIETHTSQVLLTGSYVYKIKKPVNFGFLDFSTLDKRLHCCNEEIRLNRRLAPQLYIDVIKITGSENQPEIGGEGKVIEYAVKMRQFPQAGQLDILLATGNLNNNIIDRLADRIAKFHIEIDVVEMKNRFGDFDHLRQPMLENFVQIRDAIKTTDLAADINKLEQWTLQQLSILKPITERRKQSGYVRECHGDMHLRNIAWWHDEIIIFDCIEFNPNLYWIDVMSEVAFLIMDLEDRNQHRFANRFLNRYLEITGDYEGLSLLRFYKVYRALVRAKVNALRAAQEKYGSDEYQQSLSGFCQYLDLALGYLKSEEPILLINFGLSGAGKSVTSRHLAEILPAIQVRSDVERKRLYNILPTERVLPEQKQWLYSNEATKKTYDRLISLTRGLLNAGYSVIVDAANLKQRARQPFIDLAKIIKVDFLILAFQANEAVLRDRVVRRAQEGVDVSDATLSILDQQLANFEGLTAHEQSHSIVIDTVYSPNIKHLVKRIRGRKIALESASQNL